MNTLLETINEKLTGGGCPVAGKALGECAALDFIKTVPGGPEVWEAYIYLWDDSFTDWALLAKWFLDAGAIDVVISWVMHDHSNGDRAGRTDPDKARAIIVTYVMPARPAPPAIVATPCKFTPGPWEICTSKSASVANIEAVEKKRGMRACGDQSPHICNVSHRFESERANARLIAAAPELYEVLDRLVKRLYENGNPVVCDLLDEAEKALKKATDERGF